MSDKRRFIRLCSALLVACHYQHPDAERAILWSEDLWERLVKRGYGEKTTPPAPRQPEQDYYRQLNDRQRQTFDRFWEAFNHKQGRNGAAMRWLQLGEVTDDEYRQIISAAMAESKKPLPQGQVRKMAQGWLTERRWLDHLESGDTNIKSKASEKAAHYRELAVDLDNAKRMVSMFQPGTQEGIYWESEVNRLINAIEALRKN